MQRLKDSAFPRSEVIELGMEKNDISKLMEDEEPPGRYLMSLQRQSGRTIQTSGLRLHHVNYFGSVYRQ